MHDICQEKLLLYTNDHPIIDASYLVITSNAPQNSMLVMCTHG